MDLHENLITGYCRGLNNKFTPGGMSSKLRLDVEDHKTPLDRLSLIKSSLDLGEIEGKMDENGVLHISFGAERGFDWDEGWDCVDDIYAEYFVEEFQDGDEEEDCGHSELKYRVRITPGRAAQKILEHFSAAEKVFISDLEKLFKDTYPDLHLVDGIDELKGIRPGWKLIDIHGDEVRSRSLYKDMKLWQTGYPSDALLRKVKILK